MNLAELTGKTASIQVKALATSRTGAKTLGEDCIRILGTTWASQAQLQYATAIRCGHSSTSYHEVSKQGPESRSDLPLSPMHVGLCLCLEAVQLLEVAVSVERNARILEVWRDNDSAALKLALPATGGPWGSSDQNAQTRTYV